MGVVLEECVGTADAAAPELPKLINAAINRLILQLLLVPDAHRDSRLDLSGFGSLHSSWNGCCFRSIGTADAAKSTLDVRRTQKWIKHCTHHLQLYFQGLYVKVESKSFLYWYWMLFLVVYKRRKRANWSSDHSGGVCGCVFVFAAFVRE
jgi:hypothetical protein